METIKIDLKEKNYEIEIEKDSLDKIGKKIKSKFSYEKIAVITDRIVTSYYEERLLASLKNQGFKVELIVVKPGEESKSLSVAQNVYAELIKFGLTRTDLIISFGGGVIGDLGGFIASTFLRGVDFIQVPTTLLSQIDSSVGGKVAVNLPEGKNLVGSFYQPKAVYIDTNLLKTLDKRYFHDGLAEAIKYGAIKSKYLFELFENINEENIMNHIDEIVSLCCKIKKEVVENDEFDKGERMTLNFGHTIGHGIEKFYNYKTYTHGEGVGIGMYRITRKSEDMGITKKGIAERIKLLLEKYSLPVEISITKEEIIENILMDKKQDKSKITLILLEDIGRCKLEKIEMTRLIDYIS